MGNKQKEGIIVITIIIIVMANDADDGAIRVSIQRDSPLIRVGCAGRVAELR